MGNPKIAQAGKATQFSAENQPEGASKSRKGTRDKLSKDFLAAMSADFAEHGVKVIETVRIERPADYLKVVASLQPKEVEIVTPESALSDEQVELLYQAFLARLQKPEEQHTVN